MEAAVTALFDEATNTVSYIVADPATAKAAIVDCVLDFNPKSARTSTCSADRLIEAVRRQDLEVEWILETPVHANHLSAAPYIKEKLGGRIGIGAEVRAVQAIFKRIFNPEPGFATDGGQFDHLFADGEAFPIGKLAARAMHTPGHTPADLTLSRRRRRFRRGHAVNARLRHGARRFSRRRRWSALSLHSPHSRTSRGYAPIHLPRLQGRRARSLCHKQLGRTPLRVARSKFVTGLGRRVRRRRRATSTSG
jgi:hypothetical protein